LAPEEFFPCFYSSWQKHLYFFHQTSSDNTHKSVKK
jgi:hypothetical protein